jgi:dipeptidyl-peptidase-4
MNRPATTILALLAAGSTLPAQKKPVTLDVIAELKPDTPISPVWSPDGKRFAYQKDRSVWIYNIAARQATKLVATERLESAAVKGPKPEAFPWENRNVKEESIQWSRSGDSLLIAAAGDLFLFRLAAGGWIQLTATSAPERDPKLSPDGQRVSFRRGNDLYSLDIRRKETSRLTTDGSKTLWNGRLDWVYPEELELETAHWWSPDSTRIAYLQFDLSRQPLYPHADLLSLQPVYEPQRYPKAGEPNADVRLGVVPAGGGRTRWLDTGDTRDSLVARVAWTPDSRSVFVRRMNRIQNRLDLLRVDAQSAQSSPVLREEDPYWINVGHHLQFVKNGAEFLWASERDGFRHLYRYSIDGKLLAQVTRGDWEVTDLVCVDEPRAQVYFVSTEKSPLERHLYRAGLDGAGSARVTEQAGVHDVSASPDCSSYLDTHTSLAGPFRQTIHNSDGTQVAVVHEADRSVLDKYEILPWEVVEVKTPGGAVLYGRLLKPAGFGAGKKYPAIVDVYGGPHVQVVSNAWPGLGWVQAMAHKGFVIWQMDNRGSAFRGHKWESAIFRNLGAKELEDQKTGVQHLISTGFVDPERIGIHGWSYGGFMTLNALLHAPEVFRAGVAGAPVTDWRNYDTIYTERYMSLPADNPDGYHRASPVHYAANLKGKLLLIHNFEDDNVLFQNSLQMADALQRAGKQFAWMIYPLKAHGLSGKARRHAMEAATEFFERNLK